jgi:hypothetical protein
MACCEHGGNCFTCDDCNERQSYDTRCSLEEHEGRSMHCTSCCPGAEEEEEEEEEPFAVGERVGFGLLQQLPQGARVVVDTNSSNTYDFQRVEQGWRRVFPSGELGRDIYTTLSRFSIPGEVDDAAVISLPAASSSPAPRATPSDLPKWGPELAALAEKAVMTDSNCGLHGQRCAGGVPFSAERHRPLRFIDATSFKRNPSRRHMGCEIETDHGGRPYGFVQKIIQKWDMEIHNDPSVRGREIITLPTNGDAFIDQIEELCSAFVTDGVVVTKFGNYGTGYHLHVDARDLSWSDLKRMFTLWAHVEGAALDALRPERASGLESYANRREDEGAEGAILDPRRRTGGEEGSSEHEAEAKKAVIAALNRPRGAKAKKADLTPEGRLRTGIEAERRTLATSPSGPWLAHYPSERYYALNGMSLFRYGTIEIRAFEGTSNAEDIVCWGMLWAAFTDMSKGMSRKKMLQLIQKNPRSVLLDAAPNTRTKLWLKRRWKLYAPEGIEGVKGRKGLRPVKKVEAVFEDDDFQNDEGPVLTRAELNALPIGTMVVIPGTYRASVKIGMPGLWINDGGKSVSSGEMLAVGDYVIALPFMFGLTDTQLYALPVGAVVGTSNGGQVGRDSGLVGRWTRVPLNQAPRDSAGEPQEWQGYRNVHLTADVLANNYLINLIPRIASDSLPPTVGQMVSLIQLTELPVGAVVRDNFNETYVKTAYSRGGAEEERLNRVEWVATRDREPRHAYQLWRYTTLISLPREAPAPVPAPIAPPSLRGELRRPWRR